VQCGMGRTGTLWAYEQTDVKPDVMTLAKGLGGGLPIGACVTSPDHADVLRPGDHGSTFAGGPVPCAAAHAVLDVVDDEDFLADVRAKGDALRAGLERLPVADVRSRGLMAAFDIEGAPELVKRLLAEQRLVLNATGPVSVRLEPPLTVTREEIDDALDRIARAL
jgi:acetylornithine/N-succinyldiaminopimelate aminotransferase